MQKYEHFKFDEKCMDCPVYDGFDSLAGAYDCAELQIELLDSQINDLNIDIAAEKERYNSLKKSFDTVSLLLDDVTERILKNDNYTGVTPFIAKQLSEYIDKYDKLRKDNERLITLIQFLIYNCLNGTTAEPPLEGQLEIEDALST